MRDNQKEYDVLEMTTLKRFIKVYEKSEVIFEENSQGNEMYIVRSGSVKLSTQAPGQEVVLGTLGKGEFFGEMALIDAAPRTATATSEESNTQLIALDKERFMYLIQQQPAFALIIMHTLCQRVRERWVLYSALFQDSTK